jgi:hypothetical protein
MYELIALFQEPFQQSFLKFESKGKLHLIGDQKIQDGHKDLQKNSLWKGD